MLQKRNHTVIILVLRSIDSSRYKSKGYIVFDRLLGHGNHLLTTLKRGTSRIAASPKVEITLTNNETIRRRMKSVDSSFSTRPLIGSAIKRMIKVPIK